MQISVDSKQLHLLVYSNIIFFLLLLDRTKGIKKLGALGSSSKVVVGAGAFVFWLPGRKSSSIGSSGPAP